MFNGIIYNQGIVTKILKRPKGLNIFVKSNFKLNNKDIGMSVACDGVCLTPSDVILRFLEHTLVLRVLWNNYGVVDLGQIHVKHGLFDSALNTNVTSCSYNNPTHSKILPLLMKSFSRKSLETRVVFMFCKALKVAPA